MPHPAPSGAEPLVSIIMPAYNHARYVREALRSVAAQTYPNIELIVIDDGSKDETPQIIEATLAEFGSNMRVVFKTQENAGLCTTLNRALDLAEGVFVQFLASDDAYLPEKTARSVAALSTAATDVAAAYRDGYLFDETSRRRGMFSEKYRVPLGRNTHRELVVANWLPAMGILYRREALIALGGFDPDLKFEDWDLLLRLTRTHRITRIPDKLFLYRFHSSNMTLNTALMEETTRALAEKHANVRAYRQLKADMRSNPILALVRHHRNIDLVLRSLSRKIFTNRGIQGESPAGAVRELANTLLGDVASWRRTAFCRLSGVRLGPGCRLDGRLRLRGSRGNLEIGSDVVFEGDVEFILPRGKGQGRVSIGDGCVIAPDTVFHCIGGELELEPSTRVGRQVVLQSNGDLRIGARSLIGANAGVYASAHVPSTTDQPAWRQGNSFTGITIGENCWIGHGAVVVDGAELGDSSIVGPNEVARGVHGPGARLIARD